MNIHSKLPAAAGVAKDFVWPGVDEMGYVPFDSLVPDPDQPRKFFDPLELNELAETMRRSKKGKQRETITVRLLTAEEQRFWATKGYPNGRYFIRSGGRRYLAAGIAGLETLRIFVKEYEDAGEESVDMWMLNEQHVGLTDMENALHLRDMIKKNGWKDQKEIAERLGKNVMWVSDHMALLKLSPKFQARMMPNITKKKRIKIEVGVFASQYDHVIQDELVDTMPERIRKVSQQLGWMRERLQSKGVPIAGRKREPARLRELVFYYTKHVAERGQELGSEVSFPRLFENAPGAQVVAMVTALDEAALKFERFRTEVRALGVQTGAIKAEEAKPASPTPLAPRLVAPTVPAPPAARAAPNGNGTPKAADFRDADIRKLAAAAELAVESDEEGDNDKVTTIVRRPSQKSASVASAPARKTRAEKIKNVTFYREGEGMVTEDVWAYDFIRLVEQENLEHQIKLKPWPAELPTVAQAREMQKAS